MIPAATLDAGSVRPEVVETSGEEEEVCVAAEVSWLA